MSSNTSTLRRRVMDVIADAPQGHHTAATEQVGRLVANAMRGTAALAIRVRKIEAALDGLGVKVLVSLDGCIVLRRGLRQLTL